MAPFFSLYSNLNPSSSASFSLVDVLNPRTALTQRHNIVLIGPGEHMVSDTVSGNIYNDRIIAD